MEKYQSKVLLYTNHEKNVDISNPEICKIIFHLLPNQMEETKEIVNDLKAKYDVTAFTLTYKDCIETEVIPSGCDKSASIEYLSDTLNINPENIYTIGDSANDIGMIEKYNGACMEKSLPELLSLNKPKFSSVSDFMKLDLLLE